MGNSNPINKGEYRATIRFTPSEVEKINSLRKIKKGKLEPFAKALHRLLKNAIHFNPSNPKQPANPEPSKNTTKPNRTLPNGGSYKREPTGRAYSIYTGFNMRGSEGLPPSYYSDDYET